LCGGQGRNCTALHRAHGSSCRYRSQSSPWLGSKPMRKGFSRGLGKKFRARAGRARARRRCALSGVRRVAGGSCGPYQDRHGGVGRHHDRIVPINLGLMRRGVLITRASPAPKTKAHNHRNFAFCHLTGWGRSGHGPWSTLHLARYHCSRKPASIATALRPRPSGNNPRTQPLR